MATKPLRTDAFTSISRIIDAARRLFATEGGSTTLAHIAREAGVGVATLYRHFPNREALARAVYERILTTEIQPVLAEFDAEGRPREALLDVAEHVADIMHRERGLVTSVGNLTEVTAEFLAQSGEIFGAAVARAQAAGNLRPDIEPQDVPYLVSMIITALGAVELEKPARRRYLSLLLDALNPAQATPLPPL
ncbi:TetR/AcrR family transcriptional regulator [Nocardia niigatensis]|uniref:TetR/AcrR family transcriptional regulator n=1 Tax=Nocardia niigatensis TaxID=209249 RepID=UPI0002F4506B|nr:TetR/AcrR family transcriptional regulator [Nocardia niigatensis]